MYDLNIPLRELGPLNRPIKSTTMNDLAETRHHGLHLHSLHPSPAISRVSIRNTAALLSLTLTLGPFVFSLMIHIRSTNSDFLLPSKPAWVAKVAITVFKDRSGIEEEIILPPIKSTYHLR